MTRDSSARERAAAHDPAAAPVAGVDWAERWRALQATLQQAASDRGFDGRTRAERTGLIRAAVLDFYSAFAAQAQGATAYRLCFRAVGELCAAPLFQALWRAECLLVRRFLDALPLRVRDSEQLLRDTLRCVLWQYIWGSDFKRLQGADFGRLVRVHGAEQLGADWGSTAIIFLQRHTPFTGLFSRWLEHQALRAGTTVAGPSASPPDRDFADPLHTPDPAADLREAQEVLSQGGPVHLFPDAYFGHGAITVPFLGRICGIKPTFAHLALATGARLHPASVYLDGSGGVVVRFGAALFGAAAAQTRDPDFALRTLVGKYVDYLAQEWTARPNLVTQRQMLRFLTLPRVAAASEAALSSDPRIAVCIGVYGSGSTWVFNLVREIWRAETDAAANPRAVKSLHLESEAELPLDSFEARRIILKSHIPSDKASDALLRLLALCRGPLIATIRDPRDAVASYMRRGASFDEALEAVAASARAILHLAALREIVTLRYEDGFIGNPDVFDAIASRLGSVSAAQERQRILSSLTPDAVKSTIDALCASGVISASRSRDPETGWRRDHIGDGRVGKYVDLLSDVQQGLVMCRTAAFCARFRYSEQEGTHPLRVAVITDLPFWEEGSLFAEWVRQWIEAIARVLPIVVLYAGKAQLASKTVPIGFEVVELTREKHAMTRALSRYKLLGAMFALAHSESGRLRERAFDDGAIGVHVPVFDFVADDEAAPKLCLARGSAEYPIAPMRHLPYEESARPVKLDRSRLWVITSEPAQEWDALALAYVQKLAAERGIVLLSTTCAARAEHSPEFFRQSMQRLMHPTLFIGRSCIAWVLVRQLLDLAGIPHLYLAEDCIAPLARSPAGAPSLARSIQRFLEDMSAPRAATALPDAGFGAIRATLMPG